MKSGSSAPSVCQPGAGQQQFCADLRHWRVLRGLSQRDLGNLVSYSREWVSKVEKGDLWPTEDFARRADLALDTGGVLLLRWPVIKAERAAVMPSKQPHPDRTTQAAPPTGDPLAAMVVGVLRECPGARIVVLAMDAGAPGRAAAETADGDDGHAAVVQLANYRSRDVRRRAGGNR